MRSSASSARISSTSSPSPATWRSRCTRARAGHTVHLPRHGYTIGGRETWWEGSVAPVAMDGGTGLLITAREVAAPGDPAESAERALRAGGHAGLRLFAVSGYAQPEDVATSAEAGFDGPVAKPPDAKEIERILA